MNVEEAKLNLEIRTFPALYLPKRVRMINIYILLLVQVPNNESNKINIKYCIFVEPIKNMAELANVFAAY
jgi:hypothetical protein